MDFGPSHRRLRGCVERRLTHLSFLERGVDVLVLLELLQLGLHQHLPDVHHLLHGERQALHRVAELLLRGRGRGKEISIDGKRATAASRWCGDMGCGAMGKLTKAAAATI